MISRHRRQKARCCSPGSPWPARSVDVGAVPDLQIACCQPLQSTLAPQMRKEDFETKLALSCNVPQLHILRHTSVTIESWTLPVSEKKGVWQPDL